MTVSIQLIHLHRDHIINNFYQMLKKSNKSKENHFLSNNSQQKIKNNKRKNKIIVF